MIDQHVHTNYSPDSSADINEYLKMISKDLDEYICATDHLDILDNLKKYDSYDYIKFMTDQYEKYSSLKPLVQPGVEVGYNKNVETKIRNFLSSIDFGIVLLSIHDNDEKGIRYHASETHEIDTEEIIKIYFAQMYEAVTSTIDFDVLTHMGYIFRYIDNKYNPKDYINEIRVVLTELVKRDKILEVNTGCFRRNAYDALSFYTMVLELYKELGGEKVSLGSDAHFAKDHCYMFEEIQELLLSLGFNSVCLVKEREHILHNIK